MYKADLNVHSTISDSNYTIEEIIESARNIGINHMAFTEYNTTKGAEYAVDIGRAKGIKIIPGIKISAYDNSHGKKVEILGYNYKSTNNITKLCSPMVVRRNNNCIKQIKILQGLGYNINVDIIKKIAGAYMFKQHILYYLYKTGQTTAIFGDVYKKVFTSRGACDFDIDYVSPVEAVKAIVKDGGHAVLAHPGKEKNLSIVFNLIEAGLSGVEINHYENNESDKKEIELICKMNNLFMTGGSDFHGDYDENQSRLGSYLAHESSEVMFN